MEKHEQEPNKNNREKATSGQALEIVKCVVSTVPGGCYKDIFNFFIENPKVFKAHFREMMDFDQISKESLLKAYSRVGRVSEGAIAVCKKDDYWLHVDAETGYPIYEQTFVWVNDYHNGYAVARFWTDEPWNDESQPQPVMAHIDKTGHRIYNTYFKSVRNFVDGIALVSLLSSESWAYIDTTGKIISPIYFYATGFINGFASVRLSASVDSWCHINKQFTPLYQDRYSEIGRFSVHGLAPVELLNGNWAYIDITGKHVHNAKEYRVAAEYNTDGVARVSWYEDGKILEAEIDITGQPIKFL